MTTKYIGIDDETGHEIWGDVDVIRWVSVEEHDELLATGYIDSDGAVLVEFSDDWLRDCAPVSLCRDELQMIGIMMIMAARPACWFAILYALAKWLR